MTDQTPLIEVKNLTMAYGDFIIQKDITFSVIKGSILTIMGESGCGKSTLLRHLTGLKSPAAGNIFFSGTDFWHCSHKTQVQLLQRCGVLYQSGALWSSMSIGENIALPLRQFTKLSQDEIHDLVELKLALVGLKGFSDYLPAAISGGMQIGRAHV